MSNIFHMFVGHVCLLWNNVNSDPMPIFKLGCLVFCFWNVWVLCIFWILTPYRINDMQISSHIGRFFCYVHSFLCCAEAFCFHIGEFTYLCFCSFAWGNLSRNILRLMSEHILPMFSSRSFMVSGHRFKFWIRFELIFFFYGTRQWSSFIVLRMAVSSFPNTIYWKDYPFSIVCSLLKISCPYMHGFISELSIMFFWSVCVFFLRILYCFNYSSFVI